MIIYHDIISNDELFTDSFRVLEIEDGFILKVHAKMIEKKGDSIDASAFGGNPSAEEEEEALEDASVEKGLDIVMYHKLKDESAGFPKKKDLQGYLKLYMKNLIKHLETEEAPKDKIDTIKKDLSTNIKKFTDLMEDDSSIYFPENFDASEFKCAPIIGKWDENGMGVTMFFIKCLVTEEKA